MTKFNSGKSLYFKSMMISNIGIFLFSVGFLILFNSLLPVLYPLIILTIGWYGMITGFSTVLYSRLFLIVSNKNVIRRCKYMIIMNVILFHLPTTVFTFGSNLNGGLWTEYYGIYESIQITAFFCQEVVLGCIYLKHITKTTNQLKRDKETKDYVIFHTVWINLFVFLLDILMISIEYMNFYEYQITLKAFLYSLKLKLEFSVLNQLTFLFERESFQLPEDSNEVEDETTLEKEMGAFFTGFTSGFPSRFTSTSEEFSEDPLQNLDKIL
ncbi:hypothetical protein HDV01_003920 [Terramyces sp. JEL0728]|nr:hypothetical protein HDV01_003920 [Terramyces sp. JEL0728]